MPSWFWLKHVVRDEYGQLHYVQVEPEFGELEFQSQIILIRLKVALHSKENLKI